MQPGAGEPWAFLLSHSYPQNHFVLKCWSSPPWLCSQLCCSVFTGPGIFVFRLLLKTSVCVCVHARVYAHVCVCVCDVI